MDNLTKGTGSKRFAVTMGDPAGSGPAALVALLKEQPELCDRLLYIGSPEALYAHSPSFSLNSIGAVPDIDHLPGDQNILPYIQVPCRSHIEAGVLNPENAGSVIECLDIATDLASKGDVNGIITGPIHKAALYGQGFAFAGHTEYLAARCGLKSDDVVMMLACDGLRVVPLTVHIPLADVPRKLTADLIVKKSVITQEGLKRYFACDEVRLVIAGLNPHAGEDGSIGHEEATHIQPALWQLEDMGIFVKGPLSADTLFHEEARSNYDAALCCYHDQALIPLKTLDIWGGVNVTLGLPYIRTSPDHGTAFDAVRSGHVHHKSLAAAITMAEEMNDNFHIWEKKHEVT